MWFVKRCAQENRRIPYDASLSLQNTSRFGIFIIARAVYCSVWVFHLGVTANDFATAAARAVRRKKDVCLFLILVVLARSYGVQIELLVRYSPDVGGKGRMHKVGK